MKTLILFCTASLLSSVAFAAEVNVASTIPYGEDDTVGAAVKNECNISASLLEGLTGAVGADITLKKTDTLDKAAPGRNLVIEITDAQSSGNAFIGHRKSVAAKGKLYDEGKLVGSFRASRWSMGGMTGGFKGSCAVIHDCGRAIGKDIAVWLAAPVEGAKLGNLKD